MRILCEMGFTMEEASDALVESSNDLAAAASYLVNRSQREVDDVPSLRPPPSPPQPTFPSSPTNNSVVVKDTSVSEGDKEQSSRSLNGHLFGGEDGCVRINSSSEGKKTSPLFSKGLNIFGTPRQPPTTASTGLQLGK